jgi:hypothetical protein
LIFDFCCCFFFCKKPSLKKKKKERNVVGNLIFGLFMVDNDKRRRYK